jgi:hypothetical protein
MQESLNILLERCSKLFPEEGLLLAEDEQKQIDDFIENFDRLSEELRLTLNDFNEAIATSRENSVIYLIAKNNLFLSYSKLNITIESINSFVKENQELKNTVFLGSFFKAANSKFLGIKDLLEEASAKLNIQVTENSEATNLSTDDNYSTELHSGAQEDSKLELTGEDSN